MGLRFGIGGFSFHRLLAAGKQDMFKYIEDSKALGAAQLEPWNAQLAPIRKGDDDVRASQDPRAGELTSEDRAYLGKVRDAARTAALPFGCLAVDGAHIYEPTAEARAVNRRIAVRWLDAARILGVPQVRIDCGGPEEPKIPNDVLAIIVEGYSDVIGKARALGVEIVIENHWGPSKVPDNVVRIMEAVKGLVEIMARLVNK
jgi:sugar phosphate isomerase/epimerase